MSVCKPIKCPECVPLFRYFANQPVSQGDNAGYWQLMNEGAVIDVDPITFASYALKTINISYQP